MIKFSIVIPVYNTSSFLPKCFDSILAQSFDNYEVIIVNDGSTDNSQKIIDKYVKRYKNKFKCYITDNNGPGEARNIGISKAQGEYFLFIDSDDYIEKNLLKKLDLITTDDVDLIRFQIKTVNSNYKVINRFYEKEFKNLNGPEAFFEIVNYKLIELACCYAFNREFYLKNKFTFKKNMYHEDFGLIPYIIMKANSVTSINYIGYNYIQRENSIMSTNDYSKIKKKVYDTIEHYKYLYKMVEKMKDINEYHKNVFYSFISNSTILRGRILKKEDQDEFISIIKEEKIYDKLLNDTIKRKIKKLLIKYNLKLYLKLINRS